MGACWSHRGLYLDIMEIFVGHACFHAFFAFHLDDCAYWTCSWFMGSKRRPWLALCTMHLVETIQHALCLCHIVRSIWQVLALRVLDLDSICCCWLLHLLGHHVTFERRLDDLMGMLSVISFFKGSWRCFQFSILTSLMLQRMTNFPILWVY